MQSLCMYPKLVIFCGFVSLVWWISDMIKLGTLFFHRFTRLYLILGAKDGSYCAIDFVAVMRNCAQYFLLRVRYRMLRLQENLLHLKPFLDVLYPHLLQGFTVICTCKVKITRFQGPLNGFQGPLNGFQGQLTVF